MAIRSTSLPRGHAQPRLALALALALLPVGVFAQETAPPRVGPAHGALVVVGGGRVGPAIMNRFVALAGGKDARIVVIPTASEQDSFPADWNGLQLLRAVGLHNITILHTRDPQVADRRDFVAPLRRATGVWIPGGRQWRLADAYLNTRTQRELFALLDRGGVIGGSSAGASIQASYMVRGAVAGNTIMMAPGHEVGFGFLRGVAVDQHILARGREDDLEAVVQAHPELLGIGLDEGTAIIVQGDRAQVLGRSKAAFHNTADAGGAPYYFLQSGDVFDLASRRVRQGHPIPRDTVEAELALGVVRSALTALGHQDTTALRRFLAPEFRAVVTVVQDGRPGVQVTTLAELIGQLGRATGRLDERLADPRVHIAGNLAEVSGSYESYRDGAFSYCGEDAFHLVRLPGGWRIVQVASSVRQEGCRSTGH